MHVHIKKGSLNGERFVKKFYVRVDKIKSSMQTEATMLTNISQHFWMLHVTLNPAAFRHLVTCSCELLRVAACCFCVFLRVVGSYCSKFETGWTFDPTTPTISFFPYMIAEAGVFLRPCLHGVGDPGVVGLVSFVFTLWGTQNKRNLPH